MGTRHSLPDTNVLELYHSPKLVGIDRWCQVVSAYNNGITTHSIVYKIRKPVTSKDYIGFNFTRADLYCILIYAAKLGFIYPKLLPAYDSNHLRPTLRKPRQKASTCPLEHFYNALSLYRTGYSVPQILDFSVTWQSGVGTVGGEEAFNGESATGLSIKDCRGLLDIVANHRKICKGSEASKYSEFQLRNQTFAFDELLDCNGITKPRRYLRLYPLLPEERTREMANDCEEIQQYIKKRSFLSIMEAQVQCTRYIERLRDATRNLYFKPNGIDYPGFVSADREFDTSLSYQDILNSIKDTQYVGFRSVIDSFAKNKEEFRKARNQCNTNLSEAELFENKIKEIHEQFGTVEYEPLSAQNQAEAIVQPSPILQRALDEVKQKAKPIKTEPVNPESIKPESIKPELPSVMDILDMF
jgi:hypothetical protein